MVGVRGSSPLAGTSYNPLRKQGVMFLVPEVGLRFVHPFVHPQRAPAKENSPGQRSYADPELLVVGLGDVGHCVDVGVVAAQVAVVLMDHPCVRVSVARAVRSEHPQTNPQRT